MNYVAKLLGMSNMRVYEVATFYTMYNRWTNIMQLVCKSGLLFAYPSIANYFSFVLTALHTMGIFGFYMHFKAIEYSE